MGSYFDYGKNTQSHLSDCHRGRVCFRPDPVHPRGSRRIIYDEMGKPVMYDGDGL